MCKQEVHAPFLWRTVATLDQIRSHPGEHAAVDISTMADGGDDRNQSIGGTQEEVGFKEPMRKTAIYLRSEMKACPKPSCPWVANGRATAASGRALNRNDADRRYDSQFL